jgi:saccharopine dehydrogenase (NADP+, L-glutamate forming)/spermidine synthase
MKRILVIGAGRVSRPAVEFLADQPGFDVTVADQEPGRAETVAGGRPHARGMVLAMSDQAALSAAITDADVVISLLPPRFHPQVARACIHHRTPMVTTSYVSPEMRALDADARAAGIILLNEMGVDPGIDHMSAKTLIDTIGDRGGKVTSFRSYCGGLPAPDANDNPWGYKFSWSPRGVLRACKSPARYLLAGHVVDVPASELFAHGETRTIEGVGALEAYPNRDAMPYIELLNLEHVRTMFRATLRYPGWCRTLEQFIALGLLDETPQHWADGTTFAQYTRSFLQNPSNGELRSTLASELGLAPDAEPIARFEWLGLLDDQPLPVHEGSPLDVMATQMLARMVYRPGERDMVVMQHEFIAEFTDRPAERITSTLVDYGVPHGDSAMSRTVGLPVAMGTKLIADGHLTLTGVQIPIDPRIYKPVLSDLAAANIRMVDRTEPVGTPD